MQGDSSPLIVWPSMGNHSVLCKCYTSVLTQLFTNTVPIFTEQDERLCLKLGAQRRETQAGTSCASAHPGYLETGFHVPFKT